MRYSGCAVLVSLMFGVGLAGCETVPDDANATAVEIAGEDGQAAPPTVRQWLDPQFRAVMQKCSGLPVDSKKLRFRRNAPDPTYIPAQITNDRYLGEQLGLPFADLSGQTMTRIFGSIIDGEDLALLAPAVNDQIGDNYARADDLIVAPGFSTWRYTTSCAAAASAALEARFQSNWGIAEVSAALTADMEQSDDLRQEFLYGIFESPVAAAIRGGPDTDAAAIVHYHLMLWEWQAQQAQDTPPRYLVSRFAGVAAYGSSARRSRWRTEASARMGVGSVAAARVSGSLSAEDTLDIESFNFAAIRDARVDFEAIPTAEQIAARVIDRPVFMAVQRNQAGQIVPYRDPTYVMIEGNPQTTLLQFSPVIPKRFCERPWTAGPSAPGGASLTVRSATWLDQPGSTPMSGCLVEAFTSAPPVTERNEIPLSATIRMAAPVRDSYFTLPLQTVTLGSTRLPNVTLDQGFLLANPRSDVDLTSGGMAARTSTWTFRFTLEAGTSSNERIEATSVEPGAISIEPTSCALPYTTFDTVDSTLAGNRKGLTLTLTKIHGPAPVGSMTYTEAGCTLKGSVTLYLGPTRVPVTRSVAGAPLRAPVAQPVAPPPPP